MQEIRINNQTAELADCRDKWEWNEKYKVWQLEDILITQKAETPKFQRMSIFVPAAYLNADGTVNEAGTVNGYTAKTAPVVFENNSAGYMQMPNTWLDGPRCYAYSYLEHGMIYVSCGCRGRESRDQQGKVNGKSPIALVDLKMGIRFLRHNAAALPGDYTKIISIGWSAGGAMSSLLAVTGDSPDYEPYLKQAGAYMDESDAVYAAQIYCPIIDLEHASCAYEWLFCHDMETEESMSGPAGIMSPFRQALSGELAKIYVEYFNSLGLRDPVSGEPLLLGEDLRSGSGYDYLVHKLEESAETYLAKMAEGKTEVQCTPEQFVKGEYMRKVQAKREGRPQKKPDEQSKEDRARAAMQNHAGQEVHLDHPPKDEGPVTLGDIMARRPKPGEEAPGFEPPMISVPGPDCSAWLTLENGKVTIRDLDSYLATMRRRMKPCTSFDDLENESGENHEFGTPEQDYLHFDADIIRGIEALKEQFPAEYARYAPAFAAVKEDAALAERVHLINPMYYVMEHQNGKICDNIRINVGSSDADTAFIVSMALAVRLMNLGKKVEYSLPWGQPHCEADYQDDCATWIDGLCKE